MMTLFSAIIAAAVPSSLATGDVLVHPLRAAQIEAIANTPGVLWRAAAHPRFATSPPGVSTSLMGAPGDQGGTIDALVEAGKIISVYSTRDGTEDDIPVSFDSATNWPQCAVIIGDIRDQSNCGCCWAFAGAEAASDRMCIATNATVPLSAQDACFNGGGLFSSGCDGGQIVAPWEYIQLSGFGSSGAVSGGQYDGTGVFGGGFCSDFSMPHCHHHGPQKDDPYPAEGEPGCETQITPEGPTGCDADAVPPHDNFEADRYYFDGDIITAQGEENMQRAIMEGGPMEVAFTVYADFEDYDGGIYHHVTGKSVGGHAVKVVGWGEENGEKYWRVGNSWNEHWGEEGYFRIRRGVNEGGIENGAVASSHTAKWGWTGDTRGSVVGSKNNPSGYGLKGSLQ